MSLLDYCQDDGQKAVIRLLEQGIEQKEIARLLSRDNWSVKRTINRIEKRAEQAREPQEVFKPLRYTQPLPKPLLQPASVPVVQLPKGQAETILIIPDWHQDPCYPHRIEVVKAVARFGSARRFKRVIHLGDWSTWDSCSRHTKNETYEAKTKPTIQQDLDNLIESLQAWQDAKDKDWKPKLEFVEGNHEYRLNAFENINPEVYGFVHTRLVEAFTQYGWRFHKFAEPIYINNVGFVHHINNAMGKAIGGKTGAQRIGNEATSSFVYGHTHHWKFLPTAKNGLQSGVDVLEAGCALPYGEIEHYATHSMNDWWYGVTVVTVHDGRITDFERISMLTLMNEYGE